jgi:hypothetical protein
MVQIQTPSPRGHRRRNMRKGVAKGVARCPLGFPFLRLRKPSRLFFRLRKLPAHSTRSASRKRELAVGT